MGSSCSSHRTGWDKELFDVEFVQVEKLKFCCVSDTGFEFLACEEIG